MLSERFQPGLRETLLHHQQGGHPLLTALQGLGQLVPVRPVPLAFQKPKHP